MNINDYYLKHGTDGLRRLADKAGTKLSYLQQLVYTPTKRPSLEMAQKLVKASGRQLSLKDLANPVKRIPKQIKQENAD